MNSPYNFFRFPSISPIYLAVPTKGLTLQSFFKAADVNIFVINDKVAVLAWVNGVFTPFMKLYSSGDEVNFVDR